MNEDFSTKIFSKNRSFLLTGKPGAGKTYETSKIINIITKMAKVF